MAILNANKVKKNLDAVLDEIQDLQEPVIIAGKNSSAVLMSESLWRSIEETLYLYSIPGMRESIVKGMKEKVEIIR